MRVILITILLILLAIVPFRDAGAAIYTYKDGQGRTVFVDDEHKIPANFRGGSTTIQEQRELATPSTEDATEGEKTEVPAQPLVDRETQIRARQQVEKLDREHANQTPVMVRGTRVLVPVKVAVGNQTAHLMLLLDTGAAMTVLHRHAVKELPFDPGKTVNDTVAGGRTVKAEKAVTRYLEIGPYELKDFPVMLITPQQGTNLPFDGMLGMDFLKDHPYTVDMNNEMIRWQPVER